MIPALRTGILFLCACLGVSALYIAHELPILIREQAAITRDLLETEAESARTDTLRRFDTLNAVIEQRSGEALALADAQATLARRSLTIQTGVALGNLDARLGQITASVDDLRGEAAPVLREARSAAGGARVAIADMDRAVNDVRPQVIGATAAAKVALGQTAIAMKGVETALPQILEGVQKTTDASAEASRHTSNVMSNLENATRPLPKWVRWVPPVLGSATGVATFTTLLAK